MAAPAELSGYSFEAIGTTIVGVLVILGIVGNYLRTLFAPAPPQPNPLLAGVGLELGNRQQTDQVIAALNRIADVIEGKKHSAMEETMKDILDRLERAER